MMKFTKQIVALLIIGLFLIFAPNIKGDQGYVLIAIGNYTIEGSIVEFGATIVMFVVALWMVVWLLKLVYTTLILPTLWWQSRQNKNQANYLQAGIDYMTLGQWQQAINQFARVKRTERLESANKLTGVCRAQLNESDTLLLTDDIAKDTKLTTPFATLAGLMKAHKYEDANLLVQSLKLPIAKQPLPFQQLCLSVYAQNFNWNEVASHLPRLNKLAKKHSDVNAFDELQQLNQTMFYKAFTRYISAFSINQLQTVWTGWHKAIRSDRALQTSYILALSEQQQSQLIEPILLENDLLKQQDWLLEVIRHIFKNTTFVSMDLLFSQIQKHITKQPDNKTLLTIYAYLAAGQKDFQLAKQALEQVVYSNNNLVDKRLYAMVLAELGELRYSVDVFKSIT
ncbi:heme biosynthesis HemY N-terminal domain-containing protein [Psychrosphaera algicola]|uniref:Heme biosynthesis HemY N-terminal domain-containing protein n=1 Tax=Psychrosphaera algicola TaxID=3023714 RepID=A0ABT5FFJ5_9GAMM|nr:heme biosynthesis HemY N-terminal domain-containing protein [Psychrosphaera sp. G1-22]MDC2890320.1 heme biosynthesis HemY N-terminal domain-containing protein [Psychrosphaera sp. G1-22]